MGGRGPAPTPRVIDVARGNPGKKKLKTRRDPVLPGASLANPPAWLVPLALDEWRRIAGCIPDQLVSGVDLQALAGYCDAYAEWREAAEAVGREGMLTTTPGGHVQPSPYTTIRRNARAAMLRLAQDLGFTPASRTRVSVAGGGEEKDDLEARIFGEG